jgi:hypothetical protein
MKKSVENKRGLSPAIASVLMVLLVLVLASIIFLWARGFISEQIEKFGTPIEDACSLVSFEVNKLGENKLEVINRGNINIRHLDIKLSDTEGNSEMRRFDFEVDVGEVIVRDILLKMTSGKDIESTIAYPALIGNVRGKDLNKVFTCMNVGVKL